MCCDSDEPTGDRRVHQMGQPTISLWEEVDRATGHQAEVWIRP